MSAVVSSSPDIPDEAIEAAARVMAFTERDVAYWRRTARAVLAAAYPLLVAEAVAAERERIATAIEEAAEQLGRPSLLDAARIARTPDTERKPR